MNKEDTERVLEAYNRLERQAMQLERRISTQPHSSDSWKWTTKPVFNSSLAAKIIQVEEQKQLQDLRALEENDDSQQITEPAPEPDPKPKPKANPKKNQKKTKRKPKPKPKPKNTASEKLRQTGNEEGEEEKNEEHSELPEPGDETLLGDDTLLGAEVWKT